MQIVYLNGKFIEEQEAFIPITDRGFLFGDGVFTTIRVENGKVVHFLEHMKRLQTDCQILAIHFPSISLEILDNLIKKNEAFNGIWRMKIIITGGNKDDLSLPQRDSGITLITLKRYVSPSKDPIKLAIYPKPMYTSLAPLKTLSYLERLFVKQYAIDRHVDDALTLTEKGHLLETSFSNIFWIYQEEIFTPTSKLPLLKGIALSKILEKTSFKINQGLFSLEDIPNGANLYICNCLTGVRSVRFIENQEFGRL